MSVEKCPFTIEELEELLIDDGPGWEPTKKIHITIDNNKKQITWKNDGDTWTRRMSFEILNVWKITGKHPMSVFMEEYKKTHPSHTGAFLPNVPSILESWAKDFNEKHQDDDFKK